jgi:hypothetical protein
MKATKFQPMQPEAKLGSQRSWDIATDQGCQQITVAAERACAMFRGFEAMRLIQEQAAHRALERHTAALGELQRPCGPADLMKVQSELLRFDLEGAGRYWQQLGAAALEMQAQMLSCGGHLIDSDAMLEAASAMASLSGVAVGPNGFFEHKLNGSAHRATAS